MQPINYGAVAQGYPIYPNCFDQLTTHGIVAEDVVGYITDKPSPYLQNYVAQRGWAPTMPGQIIPDPLPTLPPNQLPRTGMMQEQTVNQNGLPTQQQINSYVKNEHNNNWKKIAAGILLAGVTAFGLYKLGNAVKTLLRRMSAPAPSVGGTPWYTRVGQSLTNMCKSVGTFFKNTWNKITGQTQTGGGTPWYTRVGQSLTNMCKSVGTFFKNVWNKIAGHTPAPNP